MSRAEFEEWREFYLREPWGVIIDDRRHADMCFLLQGIINMWAKRKTSIKVDQIRVSKTEQVLKELKLLLEADPDRPWMISGQSQEQLALEGQAIFGELEKKYG